jgi:catechol 2,3-dioxygenase-like lactoylglutathione lyase family enzyme
MLGNSPVHPVLLAQDLVAARRFYHEQLGLEIIVDREGAIEFRCGGGTTLAVSRSTTGTADSQTKVAWEVADLRAELEELRSRGVTIEDYDTPGLKTENGIADIGFAWMAWVVDPGRNALAIMQRKDSPG